MNHYKKYFPQILLISVLGFSSVQSQASTTLPKGKDYPAAPLYTGKSAAQVDRTDGFTNMFRTRFTEAMQGPVVFAGEYARAEWGCGGSGCYMISFINKRTGRALHESFTAYGTELEGSKPVGEEILYINKSSKLLVTYEINEFSKKHFYNYYVLQNESLNLIKKVPDDRPQ
ncbi:MULTISPECIES: hypothetical protein [Rahnella]|uniref:hypothetical protein n=1 Tax=Rahnella TaxID=34037 RepID=UPI001C27D6DE|nr:MULTISPECIES: hypothetical protein [Rahnella]MBU9839114.1 hypothetical protein [Rahnella aceris]MCM2444220.1 hypothetical protein [Rahnella sp. CG8]